MLLRSQFIMVALLGFLSCVIIISIITLIPMYNIINVKFFNIVSGIFYSTMSDTTLSISQAIKDSLQLEINDLTISKYLSQQMRRNMRDGNINSLF